MSAAVFSNFMDAIDHTQRLLKDESKIIDTRKWQSVELPDIPNLKMREYNNLYYEIALDDREYFDYWRFQIEPNWPWAETAFMERVSGVPWNPGMAWESWPWAKSAKNFIDGFGFSHTYAERYWPRLAGRAPDSAWSGGSAMGLKPNKGIRFEWGGLGDVIEHLFKDPLTRQAYLPIWFPEDTGVIHGERVPCSLGYHFLWREGRLNITYFIRSCDFVRHYRDDLYMTMRLLMWVLTRLQLKEAETNESLWFDTRYGSFTFHCISMHCFEHDYIELFGRDHAENTR